MARYHRRSRVLLSRFHPRARARGRAPGRELHGRLDRSRARSALDPRPREPHADRVRRHPREGRAEGDLFMWSYEQVTRNLFADPKFAEVILTMPVTEEEQDQRLKNALAVAKLGWQPRLYNPHLAKWLHRIDVPTLICWGDSDKRVPPAYGPAFRDLIPGSRLEIFERCGHLPHAECAEKFVRVLTNFIAEVRP